MQAMDRDIIECKVKYLRREFKTEDESFKAVEDSYREYEECKSMVDENLSTIMDETKLRLNARIGQRQYTNCVMNQLKNHAFYEEKILLAQITDYSKISWTFWKYFDRNAQFRQLSDEIKSIEDEEVNYCVNTTTQDNETSEKHHETSTRYLKTSSENGENDGENGSGGEPESETDYNYDDDYSGTRKRRDVSKTSKSNVHRKDDFFFVI